MIIFIDLDWTLLDTQKYRDLLIRAGAVETVEDNGKKLVIPREKRLEVTNRADFNSFLYGDTIPFLSHWNKKVKLYLITFGDKEIQKIKVERSGLKPYFSEIIYTGEVHKAPFIGAQSGCLQGECAFFLDDNVSELELAARTCPNLHVVRMRRPKGEHSYDPGADTFVSVSNLGEFEVLLRCEI